ncbi:hypothetical protein DH2020_017032 [Rehmannia glutinosa]|uniref:KRR-R motif-containing protein 1 n=1 Tax=Rehmannia glutinosa TaxID=99300 RepID=A0ABR0WPN7_REHGL
MSKGRREVQLVDLALTHLNEKEMEKRLQVKHQASLIQPLGGSPPFFLLGQRPRTPQDITEENDQNNGGETEEKPRTRHKGKHDKDKPWDDPSIDHWKIEKFDPSWNESGMLEVSSFSTLFPQYRGTIYPLLALPKLKLTGSKRFETKIVARHLSYEKYLQECWPIVKGALKEHGIAGELNLVEGCMTVSTTRKTRDPYIIVKARDLIKLLSRSVPAPQAIKILNDEMQCDIIKIGSLVRNKERFVKRRQHLVGPNSSTLKALEILTGCYILVQGNTVAAMGSFKGLKQVRKVVEECILNKMHPVYNIKVNGHIFPGEFNIVSAAFFVDLEDLMKNVKQKKVKTKEKKPYTPFPPPQQPSKIDLQLESGEYFLSDTKKQAKKWQEKQEKQAEKIAESKKKREEAFVPPERKAKDFGRQKSAENIDANAYIAASANLPQKRNQSILKTFTSCFSLDQKSVVA